MHYNVIIIGAGMVGLSLACALQQSAPTLSVALVDAVPEKKTDARLIALTDGSCNLLKNLGLWSALAEHATPIKQIHVSHKNHFGVSRIKASELDLLSLGHLIPAKFINQVLEEKIKLLPGLTVFRPATLETLTTAEMNSVTLKTAAGIETLTANIIIGADGTHSSVREFLNIPTQTLDYEQTAIVTTTELQRHHHNTAYERFQDEGAIAMLPLTGNQCATIWTASNKKINELMQLSDKEFLATLQTAFGYRLGRFKQTSQRHTYPLLSVKAQIQQKQNVILIGNAAHTLHPIAAQGLNLSLYEIAELATHAKQYWEQADFTTPWAPALDNSKIQLSHQLTQLFSTHFFMFNFARQFGLIALDIFPSIKELIMRKAMGRSGHIPSLLSERELHASKNTSE